MMSAWRSPLLLLGFALIAIAAAAMLAPWFVDWNGYRAEFEAYGRKVTGRDVTIDGGIEARLFPWPALVLNEVRISNPDGTRWANFMEAPRIEMGMSLPPLISGRVEVNSITLHSPVFALERQVSGATSWQVEPDQSLPALIDPDRVVVSEISILDGAVFASDHRRDGFLRLDDLDGTVSAPSLSGPWRMRATASYAGLPFEISLSTGKLQSGEATRVGLRIAAVEEGGTVYSFDGEIGRSEGRGLKGAVKIAPMPSQSGKRDAEDGLPRFEVKADVEADFDTIALTGIEATPAFSTDVGNFITGSAHVHFGPRVLVEAVLSTARIDFDQIAGPELRDLMRPVKAFEQLGLIVAGMPDALDLKLDLSASSVVAGGETLEASRLAFEMGPERLRIEELTTAMPGQTRTRFSGLFVFGDGEPLLSGDVNLESASLRDFVTWALPGQRPTVEQVWDGIRGRLKLDAKLDVTAQGVRLSEVDAVLDDAKLTGSLSTQGGDDPGLALRVDAGRLDLDRYLTRGFEAWTGGGSNASEVVTAAVDLAGAAMAMGDFQFTAQAGELRLHGVEARDVAIDLGAREEVLELRTVEIGQVGAARVGVVGVLRFPQEGVGGSVRALVDAEDPRELLRLVGAFGVEPEEPAWAGVLGPLDIRLTGEASSEEGVTTAAVALTGTAGGATSAIEGRFRGESAQWQDGEIEISGEMTDRSSALLAAFAGVQLKQGQEWPSRLAGSVEGSLSAGLETTMEAELLGARGQFVGTIKQGRRLPEAKGRVAVLTEDAAGLFALLGLPADELSPTAQVLAAESDVTYDGRGLRLPTLSGTAGGTAFSGDVKYVSEPVRRVTGQLATGNLSLPWLLCAVLLPRDGAPPSLSSHFAPAVPPVEADLAISAERVEVLPHLAFESAELAFTIGRYALTVEGRGSGPAGEPVTGRIRAELESRGIEVDGAVAGPVGLGGLLRAVSGTPVIEGNSHVELKFSGNGRSPAGLLAALEADGSYTLERGVLKQVDPEGFVRDFAAAKQPSDIDDLFSGSLRSGDMAFAGGSGSLSFADGVLRAKPLPILGKGLSGEARFLLETSSGDIDLSFTLNLADMRDVPSFELAYAGSPRALETSIDAQSLRTYLSMQMLQDSVQKLEDLQRQEQELIEAEKKFQREQEQRERERREQQQRAADQKLDRKERELADRLRAEERRARELEAQELQAKERQVQERKADRKPEEPSSQPADEPEPMGGIDRATTPEPAPEPASMRSEAIMVAPLDAGANAPGAASNPLPVPATVPVPQLKPEPEPEPEPEAAGGDRLFVPLQQPQDDYIGTLLDQLFATDQQETDPPQSGPGRPSR